MSKSIAHFARLLETSWHSVSRLENPHYWTTLRQLSKAADVYGGKLGVSFEPDQEQYWLIYCH